MLGHDSRIRNDEIGQAYNTQLFQSDILLLAFHLDTDALVTPRGGTWTKKRPTGRFWQTTGRAEKEEKRVRIAKNRKTNLQYSRSLQHKRRLNYTQNRHASQPKSRLTTYYFMVNFSQNYNKP